MSVSVVIGGGVIGLACARSLAVRAPAGSSVILLEALGRLGSETSGRNSGVIHSGIYYPTGSTKARMCIAGRHQLYRYLEERAVPHNRCGKLIVSTSEQDQVKLHALLQQARKNGLGEDEVRLISSQEARAREPELHCNEALFSRNTGVVDAGHFMQLLEADLDSSHVDVVYNCEATGVTYDAAARAFRIETTQGPLPATRLVNCAGHMAVKLASRMQLSGHPSSSRLHAVSPSVAYFAKGSYFKLETNKRVFQHLVYPVPTDGGLGVHTTVDMAQQMRFGPDVEWLPSPGDPSRWAWQPEECTAAHLHLGGRYSVDSGRCQGFYADIRRYYPNLPDNSLVPDFSGIRPKLTGPGQPAGDFSIQGESTHGVHGLVNLFGLESPGLTSSLAIADSVAMHLLGE